MGYVPEEPYLYTHLTGFEYLIMVAQLRDLPVKARFD
jgi:ABC-2 type transport system ATP-binding protein